MSLEFKIFCTFPCVGDSAENELVLFSQMNNDLHLQCLTSWTHEGSPSEKAANAASNAPTQSSSFPQAMVSSNPKSPHYCFSTISRPP